MNKTHTNSKYIRNMAALVSLAIAAGTPALFAGQKSGEKEPLARAHLAMPQGAFASPDHPNRSVAQYLEKTYRDTLEIYRTKAVKDPAYVPKIAQSLIILCSMRLLPPVTLGPSTMRPSASSPRSRRTSRRSRLTALWRSAIPYIARR